MRFRFLWSFLLLITTNLFGQQSRITNSSWNKTLEIAKSEKKLILIEFSTIWCVPCKTLEKDVIDIDSVRKFIDNHFIFFQLDAESPNNIPLVEKFRIVSYPTLLFLNNNGETIYYKIGIDHINTPDEFLRLTRDILDGKVGILAHGITDNINLPYPQFYHLYFEKKIVPNPQLVYSYLAHERNWFSEVNWSILSVLCNNEKYTNFIINHLSRYRYLYGDEIREKIGLPLFDSRFNIQIEKKDSISFKKDMKLIWRISDTSNKQFVQKWLIRYAVFYSKTGLNWQVFLNRWKIFQYKYGVVADNYFEKMIADRCNNNSVLKYALKVALKNLDSSKTIENFIACAKLFDRLNYFNKAESFYTDAIVLCNNDSNKIHNVVFERINNSYHGSNAQFQRSENFTKKYFRTLYLTDFPAFKAHFYMLHKSWKLFAITVNEYLERIGGDKNIKNVNLFYHYATLINENSNDPYCIKAAIQWLQLLLIKDPENNDYKSLISDLARKIK